MKKLSVSILCTLSILVVSAQDKSVQEMRDEASRTIKKDPNDTIPKIWKVGGFLRFTMTQGYQNNWSAGGDKNTLGLSSFFGGYAFYKKGKSAWDNTLDLAYGFLSTTSSGSRKSDDKIDVLSKYGYDLGKNWYLSGLVNFRTQFAPGYAYPSDQTTPVLTSDFLAPAYLIVSPGLNYKPNDEFSFFISPSTWRWTFVKNDSLSAQGAFGVDSGKTVKAEFGAYSTISYTHKINANVVYTGRLDLFSNYEHNPQDVDVNWTNVLAVKVSGIITMTATFNMIYDNDVKTVKADGSPGGPAAQIQELLGIGVMFNLKNTK
ncbi:MAG TPA: DUF3078 domain-containing protein [Puia sp.]|jgi:hypothetical protein|nr:DUF3078 domain-containing protein [Puia sp.]